MVSPVEIGKAGLQGWREKVADAVAAPVASRTRLRDEHVRALVGAGFFVLSVVYVVKSVRVAARQLA